MKRTTEGRLEIQQQLIQIHKQTLEQLENCALVSVNRSSLRNIFPIKVSRVYLYYIKELGTYCTVNVMYPAFPILYIK